MPFYKFRQWAIPDYMRDGIKDYIKSGQPFYNEFLDHIFANDFVHAAGHADDINLANLPAYCAYLYNEAPAACWGSKEKIEAWIAGCGQKGILRGGAI